MKPIPLWSLCTIMFLSAAQPGAAATGFEVMAQFQRMCLSNLWSPNRVGETAAFYDWKTIPQEGLAKLGWEHLKGEAWALRTEGDRYILTVSRTNFTGELAMACNLLVFDADVADLLSVLTSAFKAELFMDESEKGIRLRGYEAESATRGSFIVLVQAPEQSTSASRFALTSFFIE